MRSGRENYYFIIGFGVMSATSKLDAPNIALANDAVKTATLAESKSGDAREFVSIAKRAEARLDFGEAIDWYQRAADMGNAESMYELGCIYFGFHDIPGRKLKDYSRATSLFKKAANLNYTPAMSQREPEQFTSGRCKAAIQKDYGIAASCKK